MKPDCNVGTLLNCTTDQKKPPKIGMAGADPEISEGGGQNFW